MARAATTTDAFNAVAEPRRREILELLSGGECSVTALVDRLGVAQPQVSKHLRVLRAVGLVNVREVGQRRVYRINARPLQEIHAWTSRYQTMWDERFDMADTVLDELKAREGE